MPAFEWVFWGVSAVLHFLFASGIAQDVGRRRQVDQTLFLVAGSTWTFATLLGGVWVVGIYWLIHYSAWRS